MSTFSPLFTTEQYADTVKIARLRTANEALMRILPLFYFAIPTVGPEGKAIVLYKCAECDKTSPLHSMECGVAMLEMAMNMYTSHLDAFKEQLFKNTEAKLMKSPTILNRTVFN